VRRPLNLCGRLRTGHGWRLTCLCRWP
jgi:hypothetical protein